MALPAFLDGGLWICLAFLWVLAISLAVLKVLNPRVDGVLRYGRLRRERKVAKGKGWRTVVDNLMKTEAGVSSWIAWTSFYVVGLFSTLLGILIRYAVCKSWYSPGLVLFLAQTMRRLLECTFVHSFSDRRVSVMHWILGAQFYFLAPMTMMQSTQTCDAGLSISAGLIFLVASAIQHMAHRALANAKPLVGKYGLPQGVLFGAVACPHYLAEIVIYGVLFNAAPSLISALMFIFVCINLSNSGKQVVDWYSITFREHLAPGQMRYAIVKNVF